MTAGEHHYALDAAALIDACRRRLRAVIAADSHRHPNLADLDGTLHSTERLLHFHLLALLEKEEDYGRDIREGGSLDDGCCESTLMGTARKLRAATRRERKRGTSHRRWHRRDRGGYNRGEQRHGRYGRYHSSSPRFDGEVNARFPGDLTTRSAGRRSGGGRESPQTGALHSRLGIQSVGAWDAQRAGDSSSSYSMPSRGSPYPSRSAEDSLLFQLIVTLQLCQVRIEDADNIICGRSRAEKRSQLVAKRLKGGVSSDDEDMFVDGDPDASQQYTRKVQLLGVGIVGTGTAILLGQKFKDADNRRALVITSGKVLTAATALVVLRRGWVHLGMNARLAHSTTALEDWQHLWVLVQSVGTSSAVDDEDEDSAAAEGLVYQAGDVIYSGGGGDTRSSRLLELIESQSITKSSIWHTYGAVRFMLIKRTMDTLYASVGAAMSWVEKQERLSRFWMPIVTAAAASYYTLTGPGTKSQEVVSSPSPDLIKKAWGVVSLPAVKHLSLQASRILKGAAIAERITISGVPCIVLSRDRFPALKTAVKRFHRQQEREKSHLSTIMEASSHGDACERAVNVAGLPKKDLIFHLTGGGFFAHTLAGDLPYLLDWSGATNSIVICPEYALLPEHSFPVAVDQITRVYRSIVSNDVAPLLGFQTDKIIVTGEAAGGNLATALCVKLCIDRVVDVEALTVQRQRAKAKVLSVGENMSDLQEEPCASPAGELQSEHKKDGFDIHLPDAIMLCCPVLNTSLELTPSRVRGTNDPVLPSGLVKAISDGYLPNGLGVDKTDPVASPFYAPDEILRVFPPMLLCESSDDPLLDDSVDFNARLRQLGVESDLLAVHNMPHAYWGLITAGFPEAKQVHLKCQRWLVNQLNREQKKEGAADLPLLCADRDEL